MLRGSLRLPTCRQVATCVPQRLLRLAPTRRCSSQIVRTSSSGSVFLGGHEFDSHGQVRSMFKELLQVHQPGEVVSHEDDADLLLALLMRHPRAESKIGPGVSHFSVGTSVHSLTGLQTQHFVLHRVDGTCSDFSYLKCLSTMIAPTGTASDAERMEQYKAMKIAVGDHLLDFTAGVFADAYDQGIQVICRRSGDLLYDNPSSCYVDHAAPDTLTALVNTWLSLEGITLDQVRRASGDNTISSELSDPYQLESWRRFHAQRAQLELVSRNFKKAPQREKRLGRHTFDKRQDGVWDGNRMDSGGGRQSRQGGGRRDDDGRQERYRDERSEGGRQQDQYREDTRSPENRRDERGNILYDQGDDNGRYNNDRDGNERQGGGYRDDRNRR